MLEIEELQRQLVLTTEELTDLQFKVGLPSWWMLPCTHALLHADGIVYARM